MPLIITSEYTKKTLRSLSHHVIKGFVDIFASPITFRTEIHLFFIFVEMKVILKGRYVETVRFVGLHGSEHQIVSRRGTSVLCIAFRYEIRSKSVRVLLWPWCNPSHFQSQVFIPNHEHVGMFWFLVIWRVFVVYDQLVSFPFEVKKIPLVFLSVFNVV